MNPLIVLTIGVLIGFTIGYWVRGGKGAKKSSRTQRRTAQPKLLPADADDDFDPRARPAEPVQTPRSQL